jgi:hypothetical protein
MRAVLCAAAILLIGGAAHARILPSFDLPSAAKAAANVVVVEEGKVVEVWAGDKKVGDSYPAAKLAPHGVNVVYGFAGLTDAEIEQQLAKKGVKRVGSVTGKRMVFFIPPEPPKAGTEKALATGHEYSTVWLEEGQAFAIQQWINPGPADIRPLDMSEAQLKQAVLDVREVDAKLQTIAQEVARQKRAQALVALLKPESHFWNNEVEASIRQCGRAAWPEIEAALAEDKQLPLHGRLLYLAHELARQDAQSLFRKVLATEREYFERLDASGEKYDRQQPPHLYHERRRSAAQWAIDSR